MRGRFGPSHLCNAMARIPRGERVPKTTGQAGFVIVDCNSISPNVERLILSKVRKEWREWKCVRYRRIGT